MKTLLMLMTIFILFQCVGVNVYASAPSIMTFQSKIISPNGKPLESANVSFRFTTLDTTGTCILYVEDFANINMTNSNGVISISLGSGNKIYPPAALSLHEVFNNSTPTLNCQAGGTISPSVTDNRQIVAQFNDGSGWQTLPQMAINSVPFSNYATRAESLGPYPAADYLRPITLPTCTASQSLTWNGSVFTCMNVSVSGSLTNITSITNASGDITLIPSAGTGTVQINSGTYSVSPTTGSLVVTGGVGISGAINAAGNISTSGNIASTGSISSTTSIFAPQLYGTSTPSGNIKIDGTSNVTKGNVLLASAGGNVGIGTTTPSAKLEVAGSIKMVDGNQAMGRTLASDGNGLASWTAPIKRIGLSFAGCNAGTAASSWDLPASGAGVAVCITDTTNGTIQGALQMAPSAVAYYTIILPSDWQSFDKAKIAFTTTDTTNGHTIIFNLATACTNPDSNIVDTPAYNSAQNFSTAVVGASATSNAVYSAQINSVTGNGCASGSILHLKISRSGSDTSTGAVSLVGWLILQYVGTVP